MSARYLLIQLSDTHILSKGELAPGIDTLSNLDAAFDTLVASRLRPDVLILSGDLAHRGEREAYRLLADRVTAFCAPRGTTPLYVPGNHDSRSAMRVGLLDQSASEDPIDQVLHIDGLRVIALDTSVSCNDAGSLHDAQLSWLATELDQPCERGTILVLHHPPVPSPIEPMSTIALQEPARLAEVVVGRDVLLILAGHNHHASASTFAGIPTWVSPATAYRADVLSDATFRGVPGSGFTRIDLIEGCPLVSAVVI